MSQENVDFLKAAIEAWNAGDMDAVRDSYHPDAMIARLEGWPEPGPFVGREAIMRQYEQVRETFDADSVETLSFIDAADRVVVRQIWRGTGSGPELKLEWTLIYTLRQGKIFLVEYFWNHAEALDALGLSE